MFDIKGKEASRLLLQLRKACRRPLYIDIQLSEDRWTPTASLSSSTSPPSTSEPTHNNSNNNNPDASDTASQTSSGMPMSASGKRLRVNENNFPLEKCWEELLIEAVKLLPVLTDDQHGEVMKLATIVLLGYLLPYSTACEANLLENLQRDFSKAESINVQDVILNMPLEERLENSIRNNNNHLTAVNDFGELDSLVDPHREVAFDSLLENAIAPLLAGRPLHREQVDLLHVLAMIIHPHPTASLIPDSFRRQQKAVDDDDDDNDNNDDDCPEWQKMLRLVEAGGALYGTRFQVHYGHRVRMIQLLVVQNLRLPPLPEDSPHVIHPLLRGALPHLHASLRAFVQGALSPFDSHLAYAGLVASAVRSQNIRVMEEEWDFLLHAMVDNKADYGCSLMTCRSQRKRLAAWSWHATVPGDETQFCPHSARGQLLASLIVRSCVTCNEVDPGLLHKLTTTLCDAIEWQLFCWTKKPPEEKEESDRNTTYAPCLLASLLFAAKFLFLFKPSRLRDEDEDPCESLLSSAIQLLSHPDSAVATEAASLLVYAFLHDTGICMEEYASKLFPALSGCAERNGWSSAMVDLFGVATGSASQYATGLFDQIVKFLDSENRDKRKADILVAVALNCPAVASKFQDKLLARQSTNVSAGEELSIVNAVLASRLARYFKGTDDKVNKAVSRFVSGSDVDYWIKYKVARQAIVTGNFCAAAAIFTNLLDASVSERHYLWISALQKLATAEATLAEKASLGIPVFAETLHSALSYTQSLRLFGKNVQDFSFQIRWMLLRLDFVDLVMVLRQITREMRLTGNGPAKNTRNHLYLQNTVKAFEIIAWRFDELGRQHGVRFQHVQSRLALRICQDLALFMASSARAVFTDVLPATKNGSSPASILEGIRHPMAALIRRLDDIVIRPMNSSVDPLVRAAAMLEVIDGILMAPFPIPRDLLLPKSSIEAQLKLLNVPTASNQKRYEHVNVWPMVGFAIEAAGHVPTSVLENGLRPVCNVVLWFRITYVGAIEEEDAVGGEAKDDDKQEMLEKPPAPRIPNVDAISPYVACINSDGRFLFDIECLPFPDEGIYRLEAKLGCQDTAGENWELPCRSKAATLLVHVSRER